MSHMSVNFFPIQSPHFVFSSISSFQVASQLENNPWIIDTVATNHMVYSLSFLTTITSTVSKFVKLPNGQFASVTHVGTVQIAASFA